MKTMKIKFAAKALQEADAVRQLVKEHGSLEVGKVNISQLYGGARGVKALVTETSTWLAGVVFSWVFREDY